MPMNATSWQAKELRFGWKVAYVHCGEVAPMARSDELQREDTWVDAKSG